MKEGDSLRALSLGTWVGIFNFEERHITGYNQIFVSLIRQGHHLSTTKSNGLSPDF